MRKLRYIHQVVYYPRHDGSGLVIVEIRKRKCFKVRENIPPHRRLHTHTHDVTVIGDEIVEKIFDEIYPEKDRRPCHKQPDFPVRYKVDKHLPRDERIDHRADRKKKSRNHIGGKYLQVRFVVRTESF